jgi:hypothetical protein
LRVQAEWFAVLVDVRPLYSGKVKMQPAELILLERWRVRVRKAQRAHYSSAVLCQNRHFWLGLPVVVLTTVVGTSVFATLSKEADFSTKIAVGIASVAAAVLAAIQTFLRFSERAESHRIAGIKFGAMKKEIEHIQAFPPAKTDEIKRLCASLLVRWNKLSEEAPTPYQKFYVLYSRPLQEKTKKQRQKKTPQQKKEPRASLWQGVFGFFRKLVRFGGS